MGTMRRTRIALGLLGTLAALGLAGCSAPEPTGTSAPASSLADEDLLCGGVSIPAEAVADRVPVDAMDEAERTALTTAMWDDGTPLASVTGGGWYRAHATGEVITVMRDAQTPTEETGPAMQPDRELLTVAWVGDATNVQPGWYVSQSSRCALTVNLGDLSVPAIALAAIPSPHSHDLSLTVTEVACNSGEDARGRITVVSVEESADQVRLVLGVTPREGMQNCPSNPATPFTVTLDNPVGDREVVDAGRVNPRPVPVGG